MSPRAVVVTGAGVVAPGAASVPELAARLDSGEPALAKPPARAGLTLPALASVFATPFPLERFVDAPTLRKLARLSEVAQLAVVASGQALASAELPASARDATGVFLGTCFGPAAYRLEYDAQVAQAPALASPLRFAEGVSNAASGHASRHHGLRGPGLTILGGEEAGLSALLAARDRIAAGGAPALLAGGVEEHSDLLHAALVKEGLVGDGVGQPFGERRAVFAQGAAVLLLEEETVARARGARVLARVLGGARGRGALVGGDLARVARRALEGAGVTLSEIDLVVGAASGGPGAVEELRALGELFAGVAGSRAYVSPQAVLGEGFGFTSAVAVLAGVVALETQRIPALPGAEQAPVVAGLGLERGSRAAAISRVLVLARSSLGAIVAIVLGRAEPITLA